MHTRSTQGSAFVRQGVYNARVGRDLNGIWQRSVLLAEDDDEK